MSLVLGYDILLIPNDYGSCFPVGYYNFPLLQSTS